MSVLTNLLPGLRDLRAPLSAGFLWLFVIYLAVAPLDADPDGVVGTVDDLRKDLGPVAQTAALAFAAYILGSFAQWIGMYAYALVASVLEAIFPGDLPDNNVVRRSLRFVIELYDVASDAARDALRRLEARHIDLLAALATIEWARELANSSPIQRVYHVDVKEIGGSDEAAHDIARQQLRHEVEENKEALGQQFGVNPDYFEGRVLASGASHVHWLSPLFAELLRDRLHEELDQMRTRLLVDQPELFSKVDRLRAESEFRTATAPALIGLAVVLWAESVWLAFASGVVAIVLLLQGARQSRHSDAALVESLRIGRVSSPSLDQVKALGTDPWIDDFWRSARQSMTSTGGSP